MSKTIYWHIEDSRDLPIDDNWLTAKEREILNTLRFAKRRDEWRLGRWVTKKALQKYLSLSAQEIEILPMSSGAPFVKIKNKNYRLALSISHREQKAIVAFSDQFETLGCDLEFVEPRSDVFIKDYFTHDELKHVERNPRQKYLLANLIWSAKESVTKVLQLGLNLDTKDVNVDTISFDNKDEWNDLRIILKQDTFFYGKWKIIENYVITLAAKESFNQPSHI